MEAPQYIIDYLRPREGWETQVYIDTEGHPTAGMGHLLTPTELEIYAEGDTVPSLVLNRWTKADTASAYKAALDQATELQLANDREFVTVLTSVNYQLGIYWRSKFPQTWKAIKEGKWALAAKMVQQSRWASQTPSRAREFADALISPRQKDNGRTGLKIAVAGAVIILLVTIAAVTGSVSN